MMNIEKTFVILKPDALNRRFVGKIISRFEDLGLDIVEMTLKQIDSKSIQKHYEEHKDKAFFGALCDFMISRPVVLMVLSGHQAISIVRKCVGATNSAIANSGTIRGDFSLYQDKNLVHASDSLENAKRELAFFFPEKTFV